MDECYTRIDTLSTQNTSLALGFFDGIHPGHKKVLQNALTYAKQLGTKSCVLTFKNHPVEILYGVIPEFITTVEERYKILKNMGFDYVIMQEFSPDLANMNAQEYFDNIILKLSPKSISIGYNHKFGAKQLGDRSFLEAMSKKYNFILGVSSPVKFKSETINSTLIRNYIKDGNVEKASQLLNKYYTVTNIVIQGMQRGRTINFPTANIAFPKYKIIPKFGVYAGIANIGNKKYLSIANVGIRPTFGDIEDALLEIHILNFNEDIYGKAISFEFIKKIRDEIKFKNIEDLKKQIQKDILDVHHMKLF